MNGSPPKDLLRVTLASIGDAVITTDTDGNITFLNPVAECLTGWSSSDAVGVPLDLVFRIVNEYTRSEVENPAWRALREGIVVGLANHTILIARDGTEGPIDDSAAPIRDDEGTVIGVVLVFRDVTERREAERRLQENEQRFRALVAASSQVVWTTDPEGRPTEDSPSWRSFTGLTLNDWLRDGWLGVVHPEDREPATELWAESLRDRSDYHSEIRLMNAEGRYLWMEVRAVPVLGSDGMVREWVGMNTDITHRKEAEAAEAEHSRLVALRADVSSALAKPQEMNAGLKRCCEALVEHLDMAFVRIWTIDEGQGELELQVSAGMYTHTDGPHSRIKMGEFKIGRIARNRQPHLTNDVPNDPNVSNPEWAKREGMVAFAGYPLLVEDRVIGVVAMFARRELSKTVLSDLSPLAEGLAQYIDRKHADERLSESERRFRAFMDNSPATAFIKDEDGRYTYVNRLIETRFGRPIADWIGKTDADLFSAEDARQYRANDLSVMASGETAQFIESVTTSEGVRHFLSFKFPLRGDKGGLFLAGMSIDITEQKLAEDASRESEEKLRSVLDSMPQKVFTTDGQGEVDYFNPQWAEFTGLPLERIKSWGWTEFIHPDEIEENLRAWRRSVSAGESFQFEHHFRRADEVYRWHLTRALPMVDASGRVSRWVGASTDIDDMKRAEESLRHQFDLTRSITDNAMTAIFMMDNESRCTFLNPAAEVMTGYSTGEARGRILHDLIHHHYPDGRPYPVSECPLDRALPERSDVAGHEDVFVRKNGEFFPVLCNAKPIHRDGRPVGTVIEVQDITEQKRSEAATLRRSEQLRQLSVIATRMNEAHDVSSVMGIITQEARTLIGAHQSVTSFTTNHDLAQTIHSFSMSEKYERWGGFNTPPDGSGIYSVVCRTNRPMRLSQEELQAHPDWKGFGNYAEGHPPMRGWLAVPMIGRDGRNLGLIQLSDKFEGDFDEDDEALTLQLARLASVAIENARLYEQLRQADRRKDEFLATLAHELRNPLAPIRTGLEVMRLANGDRSTLEQVRGTMERQTRQLISLVDDLLDVSRITRGKLELRTCRVNLSDIIKTAVEASRPFIDDARHDFEVALPERPIHTEADPNRLTQVISNLLNNAAKYTPEGGQIRLSVERDGVEAIISVRDNGLGIPPEMREGIFEMFTQIDRPMEKGYTGLGIGLTLVKSLVEMHHGRIEVHSPGANCGSDFRVRLPVLIGPAEDSSTGEADDPTPARSKCRVLVVDDNKAAAEMLSMIVKILGYEVTTAGDGVEALEVSAVFRPDVILMDIGMPRMNGYEAAQRIRQQPWGRSMMLVALTGWGQDEDKRRTKEAGFDHHLVKPAEPSDIQQLLSLADGRMALGGGAG